MAFRPTGSSSIVSFCAFFLIINGAVIIPRDALKILPKAIKFMKEKEEIIVKASKEKDFNFDKLKFAWKKANSLYF